MFLLVLCKGKDYFASSITVQYIVSIKLVHCNNVILIIFFASFMAAFLRLQTDLLSFDQNVQKVLRRNFRECVGKRNFIYWQDVQLLFFVHRQMTNYA